MITIQNFKKITPYLWEIAQSFRHDMRVSARIYATRDMLLDILDEKAVQQLINVATLPGIQRYALAMPDIHQGYGFPIGGVAAIDPRDGIISPGGVGYDINCGVRLLISSYTYQEAEDRLSKLATMMQRNVPSGLGRGSDLKLKKRDLDTVLNKGVVWALQNRYALPQDVEVLEENGCYDVANAESVSEKAKKRGADQLGTLGSGNHFLEVQKVIEIYDAKIAKIFGLFPEQIVIMIHTGSRGLGHQICTDYVKIMNKKMAHFNLSLPDRELACAPFKSQEGQDYFGAMAAAANFAWVNRQIITHWVRRAWLDVFGGAEDDLKVVYDVGHNVAKLEKYNDRELLIQRKGATRAFGPGHSALPEKYRSSGQPIFIPGSMGTASYVLSGTEIAMEDAFGSTCHGAGRRMSRTKSRRTTNYDELLKYLENYGVHVRAASVRGLVEEAPHGYKDVNDVVEVVHRAGLAKKIVKLKPVAIVKG